MGDALDYVLGVLSLWVMFTVFLSVSTVSRMSCREFLERYRGSPGSMVAVILIISLTSVIVDVVIPPWSPLFISSVAAVDISLVGYALFLRRVRRLCGGG